MPSDSGKLVIYCVYKANIFLLLHWDCLEGLILDEFLLLHEDCSERTNFRAPQFDYKLLKMGIHFSTFLNILHTYSCSLRLKD